MSLRWTQIKITNITNKVKLNIICNCSLPFISISTFLYIFWVNYPDMMSWNTVNNEDALLLSKTFWTKYWSIFRGDSSSSALSLLYLTYFVKILTEAHSQWGEAADLLGWQMIHDEVLKLSVCAKDRFAALGLQTQAQHTNMCCFDRLTADH